MLKVPSPVCDFDVISDSWFLILKTNSQTDQVTWVDQRHVRVKSYEKRQLKLKYHSLRRKYYILKEVLYFKVSAVY